MSSENSRIYEFGAFRLDTGKLCLMRNGETVPLTPKALEMLILLVENQGRVVRKEEILETVWHGAFVEEGVLTVNVHGLRRALGESAEARKYIETLSKRGYRFIAPVREVADESQHFIIERRTQTQIVIEEETESSTVNEREAMISAQAIAPVRMNDVTRTDEDWRADEVARDTGQRELHAHPARALLTTGETKSRQALTSVQTTLALAILLCATTLVIALAWIWREQGATASATPSGVVRSIAVLPLKSLNAARVGDEQDLRLGLTDALITKLGNLRQLTVRPTSAVLRYADEQDAQSAGRALGVDAVLEGSVQQERERVRVTLQLINVRDGKQMWTGVFDEKFTSLFVLEDSISAQIARALALKLTGAERENLAKHPTENAEAYLLYLRGRYLWNKRNDLNQPVINYFRRAIELDPQFANAHAGLAEALAAAGSVVEAEAAAHRAIELDANLAEAHAALGFIQMFLRRDFPAAEISLKRALELSENYPPARQWHALLLAARGEHAAAETEMRRALALDPLSVPVRTDLAQILYYAGKYDEAANECMGALEQDENFNFARKRLFNVRAAQKRYAEAVDVYTNQRACAGANSPAMQTGNARLRQAFAEQDWQGFLRAAISLPGGQHCNSHLHFAELHALAGERDKALERLESDSKDSDFWMIFIRSDPHFNDLHNDPRFVALLRRLNLQP